MRAITAVLLAVMALLTGCVQNPAFTVMSFNVRHCSGMDGKLDIPRTAAAIVRESPRFVALQEIDQRTRRSKGVDQMAELGRLTGMSAAFGRAIDFDGGQYGIGVLSAEKPLSVRQVPLPGGEPRTLLVAEFPDCVFCATHLDLSAANQVKSVDIIRQAIQPADKPVFVCGDWNALCNSKTLDGMRGFMTVLSDETGRTFHGGNEFGPSGRVDDDCIDYIAVDTAHAARYEVLSRAIIEDRTTSDHCPIVVTLRER